MPYVFAPRPREPKLSVFFNLEASVGNRGANSNRDDILLVQFLLKAAALHAGTAHGKLVKPILDQTPQSGVVDPATIHSIEAFQSALKSGGRPIVVDGLVSPARGYCHSRGYWTIVWLHMAVREDFRKQWPRLDRIPGCPGGIAQLMDRLL